MWHLPPVNKKLVYEIVLWATITNFTILMVYVFSVDNVFQQQQQQQQQQHNLESKISEKNTNIAVVIYSA
ncbi:hypothetical protein A9996_19245 [Gelidibacter algens]|nr:hypothetical protein A9996_19245 [Gelidibacter algens]